MVKENAPAPWKRSPGGETAMAAPGANQDQRRALWDSLMDMAKVGPGVAVATTARTLTDADAEGRRLFQSGCEAQA